MSRTSKMACRRWKHCWKIVDGICWIILSRKWRTGTYILQFRNQRHSCTTLRCNQVLKGCSHRMSYINPIYNYSLFVFPLSTRCVLFLYTRLITHFPLSVIENCSGAERPSSLRRRIAKQRLRGMAVVATVNRDQHSKQTEKNAAIPAMRAIWRRVEQSEVQETRLAADQESH